jgi:hypothetical protein
MRGSHEPAQHGRSVDRHLHVEQSHVGYVPLNKLQSLATVRGFADQVQRRVLADRSRKAISVKRVVVCDHDRHAAPACAIPFVRHGTLTLSAIPACAAV